MGKIGPVVSSVNYATTATSQTISKVATNPSAVKKVFQVATKVFAAIDLYYIGKPQDRKVTDAMKGSIELIEFYGSFKDIMFWINPFSKETLDKDKLLESLKVTMSAPIPPGKTRNTREQLAQKIFTEVMKGEAFYSKDDVREALIAELEKNGVLHPDAEAIADRTIIKQKARPITLLFSMACFTSLDLAGNILTLKKWGLIDLSRIAAQIGSQSRVFAFVIDLGVDTVFGTVASAALIVTFSEASYRAVVQAIKIYQSADPNQKQAAYKELRTALLDMVSSGADLTLAVAPLLFTINPPVLIGLAIFAKGTGLICILLR